jgi:hypothetical protein
MKKENYTAWIMGQVAALCASVLLVHEYNFAIGFAAFFALCILVDIRSAI